MKKKPSAFGLQSASSRTSALAVMDAKLADAARPAVEIPAFASFREFLLTQGKVRTGSGAYVPFTFAGRPAVEFLVEQIDLVLGSHTGLPLSDATIAAAGGAQWGKSTLGQLLFAYMLCRFHNVGYYLPDDDLVQGMVDTKFRPDVVDQIGWFARLLTIGKAVNESGKQVSRKGAIMATDGTHYGQGYFRGCGKIPTSFSMDAIIVDERDDIPENKAKFLSGRMTSSDLRLRFDLGTQRYHGAGQNKVYEDGSQHIAIYTCSCGAKLNPEDQWPGLCRIAMDGTPRRDDPQLTLEGDFKRPGEPTAAVYDHDAHYYFACPDCGSEIDRGAVAYEPQRPERIKQRKFSIRVSQMATPAIALKQIVADWCLNAVRDPDAMIAFCCDRLAKPKSTTQALTPAILTRARSLEQYTLAMATKGLPRFAGLDTGDRFWFAAREVESPLVKRLCWLEQVSPANARTRVPQLFATLGLACLFIDIGNERQIARDLVLLLNGLVEQHINLPDAEKQRIDFGNGLVWDGERKRWLGLKCAAVEFSLKPGGGVVHTIRRTQEGLYYPVIQANRDETIQHVVDELLTADDGFIHVINGKLRTEPILRLPVKGPGAPAIVETFEMHLLAGSRKEKNNDGKSVSFVDKVENHLLLADGYSALAETVGGSCRYEKPGVGRVQRNMNRAGSRGRGVVMC